MKNYNLINQRATTCKHGGHCEWIACDKCSHYEPDVLNQQPCEDCISRQAVNDGFKKYAGGSFAYGCMWDYINKLPSVTPKEKTGRWIRIQSGDGMFPQSIVCSKCNNENSHLDFNEHAEPIGKVFITSRYCPNCGARMEVSE